jgi:NADPH:quinone reductase
MRAVVKQSESPAAVAIEEFDDPRPEPDQALVSVRAFSVNRGELKLLETRPGGWRPGQDIAGTVEGAARDGSGPPAGSRVVGLVEGSGWAERVAVSTDRLAVLPDGVDFPAAATLPIAGLTALRTLRLAGNLLGRRVLVTGASGAVGGFQVQLAATSGAFVVGVARRDKQTLVRSLGAGSCVASVGESQGLFDLILESIGGDSLREAIGQIAPGGTIVLLGNSSRVPTEISFSNFVGHEAARLQIYHSYFSKGDHAADLELLLDMLASGKLDARVDHLAPWSELGDALERLRNRAVTGKVVLEIG